MFTVDATANSKFTTTNYIPISSNSAVQSNAVPGTIDVIKVSNAGIGYSVYETGTIQQVVDQNTIKISSNSSSFNNYYACSSIYLKSGFGAGQVRQISASDGTTKNITLTSPIDYYRRIDLNSAASIISGGAAVGQYASQVLDTIQYLYGVGYFNANDGIVQSDSGVAGTILSANGTTLVISKNDKTQTFNSSYALRATSDTGTLKTDKVNITNGSLYIANSAAGAVFTTDYAVNNYIRVGENAK